MSEEHADKQVGVTYPCEWQYTVIGCERAALVAAITDALGGCAHTIADSKTSKKGKYLSLVVTTMVESELQRDTFFMRLKEDPAIVMVL